MTDELNELIKSLPEEEKRNFFEKVKLQAQSAVKTAAEKNKKEEEKKTFKASGLWESSDQETTMTIDIKEEQRDQIEFYLSSKDEESIQFSMTKNEFFNFAKMVEEAHKFTKEEESDDSWKKYITDIANALESSVLELREPRQRRRNGIFYIR